MKTNLTIVQGTAEMSLYFSILIYNKQLQARKIVFLLQLIKVFQLGSENQPPFVIPWLILCSCIHHLINVLTATLAYKQTLT